MAGFENVYFCKADLLCSNGHWKSYGWKLVLYIISFIQWFSLINQHYVLFHAIKIVDLFYLLQICTKVLNDLIGFLTFQAPCGSKATLFSKIEEVAYICRGKFTKSTQKYCYFMIHLRLYVTFKKVYRQFSALWVST